MCAANFAIGGILCEVDCEHCKGKGTVEVPKVKPCKCLVAVEPEYCGICGGTGEDKTSVWIVKCGRCDGGKVLTPFGKEMLNFITRHLTAEHTSIDSLVQHNLALRRRVC